MPWELDSDRPIYTQIVDRLKHEIVSGFYPPGSRLPSVRDLAAQASVNPNTMQKAFTELERTGLIVTRRTSGRTVTEDTALIEQVRSELAEPWMLIVSKLTIGTIWFYLIDLLLVGAITLITLIALPTMAYFSPEDLLELRTMFQSYHTIFTVPSILFLAIPVMIISSVFSLLTIYASISLGQLFSSHKVLASILCYLGLSTILSTAMMLLTTPTTAGVFILQSTSANPMTDFASIYWSIMLISLFANLVLCVPAFWICNYVMKRCLNLD